MERTRTIATRPAGVEDLDDVLALFERTGAVEKSRPRQNGEILDIIVMERRIEKD